MNGLQIRVLAAHEASALFIPFWHKAFFLDLLQPLETMQCLCLYSTQRCAHELHPYDAAASLGVSTGRAAIALKQSPGGCYITQRQTPSALEHCTVPELCVHHTSHTTAHFIGMQGSR